MSWSTSPMRVRKRDGSLEPVDVNKIVRAVARCCEGLDGVDPMRVAPRTICGLCDGATTVELDALSIRTAAGAHDRGAQLLPPGRPAAVDGDRQGGAPTRTSTPSPSRSPSVTGWA